MFSIIFSDDYPLRREAEEFLEQWYGGEEFITAHTSGSTGEPKEIRLPKQDMLLSARATNLRFSISASSRLLCPLSPAYIAGKMMIVRAIAAQCAVAFVTPSNRFTDSDAVNDFLKDGPVALLPVVPSQCQALAGWEHLPRIDNIIVGGAPLSPGMEERLANTNTCTAFYATYGMTETCSHVALRRLGEPRFEAMPGITFTVDVRDCLTVNAPEYSFGRLQTNDIVRLTSPRTFEWLGRYDNVINSGGIKIFPEKLERELAPLLPFQFYIKGIPSEKWGAEAALVCPADAPLDDAEILALCRSRLAPFQVPRSVIRMTQLSLTSTGKIRRI